MVRSVKVAACATATISAIGLVGVSACGSDSSAPSASTQAGYVSDVRTIEKDLGGMHLTDQQLIAVARSICGGLDSGKSRDAESAYAIGRVGPPLATTVYTESVHVFCPRHERG